MNKVLPTLQMTGLNGAKLEKEPAAFVVITKLIAYCTNVGTCVHALNVQMS